MVKKRVLAIAMGIEMAILTVGCNSKNNDDNDIGSQTQEETEDSTSESDYDVNDYVVLGEYLGIEVEKEDDQVTDEELQEAVDRICKAYGTLEKISKTVVETGDIVDIDYEGMVNRDTFEGGSATGANLEIGSDTFIDGFEEGLIGARVGDTVVLYLTFPEDYSNNNLAGEQVIYNVTINYIGEYSDINDEICVSYFGEKMTKEEFLERLRSELEEEKSNQSESNIEMAVMAKVLENSTIKGYPDSLYDDAIQKRYDDLEEMAAAIGVTIEDYLEQYGYTVDEYDADMITSVEDELTTKLITEAITKKEDLWLSEKEYNKLLDEYAQGQGTTSESLISQYGEEEMKELIQYNKTWEYVMYNAVIN